MRLVLDTNVLISGLLSPKGPPGQLLTLWNEGQPFTLITAQQQLDEILRVARYPKIASRVPAAWIADLVDSMRALATVLDSLPEVTVSRDPDDDFLLAMAQAGRADWLVTGDQRDLIVLRSYEGTRIVTAREALEQLGGRLI